MAQIANNSSEDPIPLPPIESLTGLFPFDMKQIPCLKLTESCSTLEDSKDKEESKKSYNRSKFTPEEDLKLTNIITRGLTRNWNQVAILMGTRNARQCRERWNNYLNPYIRNDPWSPMEDALLIQKYKEYGSKWRKIAKFFHNRSDNALRNRMQLLERHVIRYATIGPAKLQTGNRYYCF